MQDPYNTQNYNRYGYVLNNPLSYVDTSGEYFWVAVAIGALIGGVSSAVKGGDFLDIVTGTIFGAVIGGISYGVGNIAAGGAFFGNAVTSYGFSSGFAAGAAGGAAGGFLGGAANTWLNGGSFFDGFSDGIFGAIMGGYSGGAIGGVSGVFNEVRLNKHLNSTESNIHINSDGTLTPSTETLEQFSDDFFPNFKYRNNARLLYDDDYISSIGITIRANTEKTLTNGKYNIRFGNLAFTSKKQLFLTMGHEYVHVSHLSLRLNTVGKINGYKRRISEYAGYYYNETVLGKSTIQQRAKGWLGYRPYEKLPNSIFRKLQPYRNFSKWGIPTRLPKF